MGGPIRPIWYEPALQGACIPAPPRHFCWYPSQMGSQLRSPRAGIVSKGLLTQALGEAAPLQCYFIFLPCTDGPCGISYTFHPAVSCDSLIWGCKVTGPVFWHGMGRSTFAHECGNFSCVLPHGWYLQNGITYCIWSSAT